MSAPQTNLPTQERRHRGPIVGIIVVVLFALGLLFFLLVDTAEDGTPVDSGAGEIDGRTGEPSDAPMTPPADPPTIPDGDLPPVDTPTPDPDLPSEPLPDAGAPAP
jgi:hypothetical protein